MYPVALTFAELSAAFLLLRVDYALLLALAVAVVDMLPVLGTGTVLIPWAAADLLTGAPLRAAALMVTYGVVTLVRSFAEPKLVGSQIGLPPAAALAAMYMGFRAVGVAGMVLSPVALMVVKQLNDRGYVKLWR
jgi:predicted PurR-regulated permease PerM